MGEPETPPKPAAKVEVEVSGQVAGFDVTVRYQAGVKGLAESVRRLAAAGLKPARPASPSALPDGTPVCGKHAAVMAKHEKQGDSWWSHQVMGPNGDWIYCKGRPGGDSPGWAIEP